jgi:hypothetical protein
MLCVMKKLKKLDNYMEMFQILVFQKSLHSALPLFKLSRKVKVVYNLKQEKLILFLFMFEFMILQKNLLYVITASVHLITLTEC